MPLLDPDFATRRRLQAGLVLAGALAGFMFGVILTRLGKIVAGAPPATIGNYLWNAAVFALLAAVCSPIISWSFLRRVPLWRTIVEPLLWAAGGGAAAVALGAPALLLLLPPAGIAIGVLNLRRQYPDTVQLLSSAPERDGIASPTEPLLGESDQGRPS
jgi:hypothetical protein